MEVESTAEEFDGAAALWEVEKDLATCENRESLWVPLIFSVSGRGLPCDRLLRVGNFQAASEFFDELIAQELSLPRLYAVTFLLETAMKKSLGSKRVSKTLAWLDSNPSIATPEILSRSLSSLAMAARAQPHFRVCERLLEISSQLQEEKNFQAAYWCTYVALISGRDRTGEQEPWWVQRTERVLRNLRSFATDSAGVPLLLRLIETIIGNLSPQIFLAAPLILDLVMLFPCAQENELKTIVFTLLGSIGHAAIKNINAVADQRHRDILKSLIEEYHQRHKFRGKV